MERQGIESDDDDLQRAIQLSLQMEQVAVPRKSSVMVDLTGDDDVWPGFQDIDDMEFWKAIAVSMGEGNISVLL